MRITNNFQMSAVLAAAALLVLLFSPTSRAEEQLPWGQSQEPQVVTPDSGPVDVRPQGYENPVPPGDRRLNNSRSSYPQNSTTSRDPGYGNQSYDGNTRYRRSPDYGDRQYETDPQYDRGYTHNPNDLPPADTPGHRTAYSDDEIMNAGHKFFGTVSSGLAKVIEYAFSNYGKPNGYILGEGAGGAFVAGLRYGEGILYTKDAGDHRVYWQGPSVGYDFGAEGSKTMILVYNMRDPSDIYRTYSGVAGSAYLVGGVSLNIQKNEHVTLAPIRSGIGLRLGANVGYLKYTRRPTWNPF